MYIKHQDFNIYFFKSQIQSSLINLNGDLLCALGVSHPALGCVREISNSYKFASKLTGAGGGGCAIILLPYDFDIKFQDITNKIWLPIYHIIYIYISSLILFSI